MPSRDDAYLRHQQTRWLRHDAARWVRPDAARFLKPGTRVEDVFPALALKYSPNQPRVPAGNGIESGRWTDGSSSGRPRVYIYRTDSENNEPGDAGSSESDFGVSWPMGSVDIGDIASEIDKFDLFGIKPRERDTGGVQLAGDPPRVGDNGGPPLDEPPEIPKKLPDTPEKRMGFVRAATRWLARVGRYSPLADAFFGAAEQVDEINRLTDMIRTANDPPGSLEELRDRATQESERGDQDHHIVGQHRQNRDRFGDEKIDSYDNKVRISTLKHLDLNGWYSRPNPDFDHRSPRDYLRDKSWEEQMSVGLGQLRKMGIIKP